MNYWLVKQEPDSYSWVDFVKDGKTAWTGVRNFAARLNLRAMKKGDRVFYYHSNTGKEIVGVARVLKEAYRDPTATEGDWTAVDLAPEKPLKKPIGLDVIKTDKMLKEMKLVKLSRLSVSPVTKEQFDRILELSRS
ncbi:MAG TPA: EVE domain-containing protein [Verrucomicrobiae bacterium]|jgi:predicted RNA-binding protein with PUA-like domain|nr:EVE domain-containing protein [Verrucomicrobiae bacterium]